MPTLLAKIQSLSAPPPGALLPDGLSPREAQILKLVAQGLSNSQVGAALSISEHTAANHVRSILRKTGCANRTEAASYAHRHGLASGIERYDRCMPVYMIERTFAEQLDLSTDDVRQIDEINADEGVQWLFSFLSADRRRTYCLYEAPSAEAIVAAAQRANVPADVVVEVGAASPELTGRLREWADALPSG